MHPARARRVPEGGREGRGPRVTLTGLAGRRHLQTLLVCPDATPGAQVALVEGAPAAGTAEVSERALPWPRTPEAVRGAQDRQARLAVCPTGQRPSQPWDPRVPVPTCGRGGSPQGPPGLAVPPHRASPGHPWGQSLPLPAGSDAGGASPAGEAGGQRGWAVGRTRRPRAGGRGAGASPEEHPAGFAVGGPVERVHLEAVVVGGGFIRLDV